VHAQISQFGITWTFDKPARVGRFVNGDYYVVGPVTVAMIDPKPLWGHQVGELINREDVREEKYPGRQARNGSMLNPPAREMKVGFDSRIPSGRYVPELFSHLPIAMVPGDALVSTISRRNDQITAFEGQHVDPLRVAAVLSCVARPQPPDAFRPSYCDSANSPIYLARDLRRNILLKLPRVHDMPENLDAYVVQLQKPWLDIAEYGFAAPVENLPNYGQQFVEQVGQGSLLLLTDYAPEQKEALIINMTQAGIDFWGLVRAGRTWRAHGGLNSGRKWLILQAGLLLGEEDMQTPTKRYPTVRFHEDDQTAFCPYTYNGQTFETGWTGAKAIFTGHSPWWDGGVYGAWDAGWGPVDLFNPVDWPLPRRIPHSEAYRRASTSPAWVGEALAARLMHAEKVWDHDAFFAYVDRWMTEDDTPFVKALRETGRFDYTEGKLGEFGRQGFVWGPPWVKEMWLKYRDDLPPAPDGSITPPAETTWK
jgi:hypothetical protein